MRIRPLGIVGACLWFSVACSSGWEGDLSIARVPGGYRLEWPTQEGFLYSLEKSSDLSGWEDAGVVGQGTGSLLSTELAEEGTGVYYYRVREDEGNTAGDFLVLPSQNENVKLSDGVCFAFDLNRFVNLPAKIRIYQNECIEGQQPRLIGMITEFSQIDGVKFVRGSAIWLPEAEGEYEVLAVAVDGAGNVMGSASRTVLVDRKNLPVVAISGGPDTPSATPQRMAFRTLPSEEVRRVEFYDDGVLVGYDTEQPFGDRVEDLQELSYELLRGTHSMTALPYDANGTPGSASDPYEVVITEGNARPRLSVTSPLDRIVITQGDTFSIQFTLGDDDGMSDIVGVIASRKIVRSSPDYEVMVASDFEAPFGELSVDTTDWELGTHTVKVIALDSTAETGPVNLYDTTGKSYPVYLTVYVRSDPGASFAESLVSKIVEEGSAVPSGEIFSGFEESSGEFEDGLASGLQMDSGVLMTTGLFSLWDGGDTGDGQDNRGKVWRRGGDIGLEDRITGRSTEDATALEFDVLCENGQLEFSYQFGSEEYDEFVGFYNDAFMVIVDGSLVTFVPDCSSIVAVNSVNNGNILAAMEPANPHLYLDDDEDIDPSVAPENQERQVEYDGMTIRLVAHVFVEANTAHRIRLVIADVNDGRLDSGLFVNEGSVRTVEPVP